MQEYRSLDTSIHFKKIGKGKPLLLLHGFLEDHSMWNDLLEDFHGWGYEVILIDLPCHGLSRYEKESCSMQEMARCVHDFVEEHQIDNPKVIGHSMGGYVGLELLHLGSYDLTLLHSNFWADSDSKKRDRDRVIRLVHRTKDLFIKEAIPHLFYGPNKEKCRSAIETIIKGSVLIPAEEIAASSIGLRDRRGQHALFDSHEIKLIHGTEDPVLPNDILDEELLKLNTKPRVFRLENCGHMSIWESPEALIESLKTILV